MSTMSPMKALLAVNVVVGGLALVGCSDQVGTGTPSTTTTSRDDRARAAHRNTAENGWTRGGAWRIIDIDRDPYVVAIALAKDDVRMLTPVEPQGYDMRRVTLNCPEGRYTMLEGARSARDAMPPALVLKGYPSFDATPAIRSFCGTKGAVTRGGVTMVMRTVRARVLEARRSQMDAMARDGVRGARR